MELLPEAAFACKHDVRGDVRGQSMPRSPHSNTCSANTISTAQHTHFSPNLKKQIYEKKMKKTRKNTRRLNFIYTRRQTTNWRKHDSHMGERCPSTTSTTTAPPTSTSTTAPPRSLLHRLRKVSTSLLRVLRRAFKKHSRARLLRRRERNEILE